jgi:hypothetical protein
MIASENEGLKISPARRVAPLPACRPKGDVLEPAERARRLGEFGFARVCLVAGRHIGSGKGPKGRPDRAKVHR